MSTYRPASELSRLNASAGTGASLVLSPETAAVLATALDVGRESGGAFDVTVGPLVGLWDFFRDRIGDDVEPPTHAAIDSTLALVGQEKLRYDPASRRVSLPLRGMMLDFGAIAKGYALDCAAGAARRAGASSGLMDLGGQVLCFGDPPDGERWRIGVRHPRDPDVMAGVVEIESGSLSTSGDYHRFTTWKGRRYSSHFDPRSGWPVQGLAAVTVLAPSGIEADAWSTALFVLGAERGRTAIEARDDLGALWFLDPGARPLDVGDTRITGTLAGRVNLSLP
jgi:thiamine biosynthesis lipoprotein